MAKKRLFVLAGGTATSGGSGFENLVARQGDFEYEVVGVASHHEHGGVRERADRLKVPFFHMPAPWEGGQYRHLMKATQADFVACSGWVKPVRGLDPSRTFNIHPAPLPQFGGKGMYGHRAHEAVFAARLRGELMHTAICMHFVTDFDEDGDYDRGPVFFQLQFPINPKRTLQQLIDFVNDQEHDWQSFITDLVVTGRIHWSGRKEDPVMYPDWYTSQIFLLSR